MSVTTTPPACLVFKENIFTGFMEELIIYEGNCKIKNKQK